MQIQSISAPVYKANFNARRSNGCEDCSPNCRRRGSISPAVAAALAAMVLGGTEAQSKMNDKSEVNPSAFVTAGQDAGDFTLTRSVDSTFPSGVRLTSADLSQESPLSAEMRELFESAIAAKRDTQGKTNYSLLNTLVEMGEVILPSDDLNNPLYKEKDIRKFLARLSGVDTNKLNNGAILISGEDIDMKAFANGSNVVVKGTFDNDNIKASVNLADGTMIVKSEDGTKLSLDRDSYKVTKEDADDMSKYGKRRVVFAGLIVLLAAAAAYAGGIRKLGPGEE